VNLTSRHYFECESFSFNHEHLKNLMLWCYMCIFIKKKFFLISSAFKPLFFTMLSVCLCHLAGAIKTTLFD